MSVRLTQIPWRLVTVFSCTLRRAHQCLHVGASGWSGYEASALHHDPGPGPGEGPGGARGAGGGEHHHHPGGARHLLQAWARDPGQHHLCGDLPQAAWTHVLVSQWPGHRGIATQGRLMLILSPAPGSQSRDLEISAPCQKLQRGVIIASFFLHS